MGTFISTLLGGVIGVFGSYIGAKVANSSNNKLKAIDINLSDLKDAINASDELYLSAPTAITPGRQKYQLSIQIQ